MILIFAYVWTGVDSHIDLSSLGNLYEQIFTVCNVKRISNNLVFE